jgi:tight adherence protein D
MTRVMTIRAYVFVLGITLLIPGCGTSTYDTHARVSRGAAAQDDQHLYFAVIQGLHSAGRSQAALAYLDDFDKRYPDNIDAEILRGNAWVATGQNEKANQIFQKAVKEGAVSEGNEGLGKVCAKIQDWLCAARHFAIASRAKPTDPKLLNNLGYALLMSARIDDAYDPLARAVELQPTDKQIRNNLLIAEYWGDRRAAAIARIEEIDDNHERNAVRQFISQWKYRRS